MDEKETFIRNPTSSKLKKKNTLNKVIALLPYLSKKGACMILFVKIKFMGNKDPLQVNGN